MQQPAALELSPLSQKGRTTKLVIPVRVQIPTMIGRFADKKVNQFNNFEGGEEPPEKHPVMDYTEYEESYDSGTETSEQQEINDICLDSCSSDSIVEFNGYEDSDVDAPDFFITTIETTPEGRSHYWYATSRSWSSTGLG